MYNELDLLIYKYKIPKSELAEYLKIGYNTFLLKLNGKSKFTLAVSLESRICFIVNSDKLFIGNLRLCFNKLEFAIFKLDFHLLGHIGSPHFIELCSSLCYTHPEKEVGI